MKKIYIIVLILSKQLFGAAMSGSSSQDRFDRALERQGVVAVIRAFVDLPGAERSEDTCNYQKFTQFIAMHKDAVRENMQLITDMYPHADHPLRLYLERQHKVVPALMLVDQQQERSAEEQVVSNDVHTTMCSLSAIIRTIKNNLLPVWQGYKQEQDEKAILAARYAELNRRYAVKPSTQEVPAKTAHLTLQQKIITQYVQEYVHKRRGLAEIIDDLFVAAHERDTDVAMFAREFFCPLLKEQQMQKPSRSDAQEAALSFFIDMSFYPEPLRQFFTGVSLEHYDMHGILPQLTREGDYYEVPVDYMGLNSLHGLQNIDGVDTARSINACYNNLTEIPNMSKLTQLQELFLAYNRITRFPDRATMPANLKHLSLVHNQLTELPNTIHTFVSLKTLCLAHNQITCLPATIDHLNQLRYLDLGYNKFTILPDKIFDLTQLTVLHLSGNQFTLLPDKVCNLIQLRFLFLDHNQLTLLPETIYQLSRLRSLNLRHNPISPEQRELITLQMIESWYDACSVYW